MEGIFFYWFMWLAWIVSSFLMKKGKIRLKLTVFILITIVISEFYLVIGTFNVRVSLLLFLALGYYLAVKQQKNRIFLMTTLTLTFAYAGILLFRIYDPVWFVFDYRLIVSAIVSVLAIYLGKHSVQKYALYIISLGQGEFLYWFVLGKFHNGLTIGTAACLDMLVIGCSIIYLWTLSQNIILYIEQTLQKPAKEKQG